MRTIVNAQEIRTAISLGIADLEKEANRWTKRCDDAKRIPDAVIGERGYQIMLAQFKPLVDVLEHKELEYRSLVPLFTAAIHALRSYQFGNASPELAESVANDLEAAFKKMKAGT